MDAKKLYKRDHRYCREGHFQEKPFGYRQNDPYLYYCSKVAKTYAAQDDEFEGVTSWDVIPSRRFGDVAYRTRPYLSGLRELQRHEGKF